MLIKSCTTFALRCPQCGQLETETVSRFSLGGGQSVKVGCSCGYHKLSVSVRSGQVWLQVPCYLCDGVHFQSYPSRQFWDGDIKVISCLEADLQLGAFGPLEEVERYVASGAGELDRLLEDTAFGDYFDHPEAMYHALNRVHNLAEEGLLSCRCGNRHISVDMYPERLELFCPTCSAQKIIPAATADDMVALEKMGAIEIGSDSGEKRKGHKR